MVRAGRIPSGNNLKLPGQHRRKGRAFVLTKSEKV